MSDASSEYIPVSEARELIGLSLHQFGAWMREGYIPTSSDDGYPKSFVEQLLKFTRGKTPNKHQAQLCHLAWQYNMATDKETRRRAISGINDLRSQGVVCNTGDAAELTGHCVKTIRKWVNRQIMPAVRIGPQNMAYILRAYVLNIKRIEGGLIPSEAAEVLGISEGALKRLVRRGVLKPKVISGKWYFDPGAIERLKTSQAVPVSSKPGHMLDSEAIDRLGVTRRTFRTWANLGAFTLRRQGHHTFVPTDEVDKLEERRTTLGPDFAWLSVPQGCARYNTSQSSAALKVSPATLTVWANEGIVPHYMMTPPAVQKGIREYPKQYIDQLAIYAGGSRVTREIALEYLEKRRKESGG